MPCPGAASHPHLLLSGVTLVSPLLCGFLPHQYLPTLSSVLPLSPRPKGKGQSSGLPATLRLTTSEVPTHTAPPSAPISLPKTWSCCKRKKNSFYWEDRVTEIESERGRNIEREYPIIWLTLQMAARARVGPGRSQELPESPVWVRGPGHSGHRLLLICCFSRCIRRELGGKRSSQDANQHLYGLPAP